MDAKERLRQEFNRGFKTWEIELPIDAMEPGVVWMIVQRGWTIWTLFGFEGERPFLDYYAMHRMTSDSHIRLYGNGEAESLPAIQDMHVVPQGGPEKEAEAKAKFIAHNRAVQQLLDDKGFVMTDQAHGSAKLNRYLLTRLDAEDAAPTE